MEVHYITDPTPDSHQRNSLYRIRSTVNVLILSETLYSTQNIITEMLKDT